MEPVLFYGGEPYTYIVSKPGEKPVVNIVPFEIAYFHWAVEIDPVTGELRRAHWLGELEHKEIRKLLTDMLAVQIEQRGEDSWPAIVDWYRKRRVLQDETVAWTVEH
jgi:hypothetical protein